MKRQKISVWLMVSVAWLVCCAAVCPAYVWFGAQAGPNGVRIVCHEMNRDHVMIGPGTNAIIAAVQLVDENMSYDVTSSAQWNGLRVVPHGPYQGCILAWRTGMFTLAVAHTVGPHTFRDSIAVGVTLPNDTENDGMLDAWEEIHGLDARRNDAADDPDGDGVSNLHEFWNGTHPGVWQEVFAFPPLHRYPYSNGCYCAPDVNLEWFASTTLGRYEVEAAVWPGCAALVYRGTVWNTNPIGDAIVHTADLSAGLGTQVAFRVRAAFTNEAGWTAWSGWRPFTVLQPLEDHTLRLANGQPLRGMYFMFWDQSSIIGQWAYTNSLGVSLTNEVNWFAATNTYWWPFDWQHNDIPCVSDLFLISQLGYNTLMLDQQTFVLLGENQGNFLFITNTAIAGSIYAGFSVSSNRNEEGYWVVVTNLIYWNTNYWNPQVDRDNRLTRAQGLCALPWLSSGSMRGSIALEPQFHYYEDLNRYIGLRYAGEPLTASNALYQVKVRSDPNIYSRARHAGDEYPFFPDLHHPLLRDTWVNLLCEYVTRYADDARTDDNALLRVQHRGEILPVIAPVLELSFDETRDFSDAVITQFQAWLQQRYGAITYLNAAWGTNCFASWEQVDPVGQDGTVFRWEWRQGGTIYETNVVWQPPARALTTIYSLAHYVRACDDFDEFSIERYCAAWRAITERVTARRKMLFAVEIWGQSFYDIGPFGMPHSSAPLHRIVDWADIVIKRAGYTVYTPKQRQAFAEMQKSGMYRVHTIMSDVTWQPAASQTRYSLRYLAEQGLENYHNVAVLAYNELLWRPRDAFLTTFIYALPVRTTEYGRFATWVEAKGRPRVPNGSFEAGASRFVPAWTWWPQDRVAQCAARSSAGMHSLRVTGGPGSVQLTSSAYTPAHTNIYIFLCAVFQSATGDVTAALDISLNNAQHATFQYVNGRWCDARTETLQQEFCNARGLAPVVITDDTRHGLESQWTSLLANCAGISNGRPVTIGITAVVPGGATLFLDNINLIDVP